ncbi:MAG TPA: hypothetical protein VMI11_02310 [Actinomycetes bacterium]|nr:hypothetical protein [Actinomycetes bacterium]
MSALLLLTHLVAEKASSPKEEHEAILAGLGVFLGLALLLFIVTRFNRDR